MWGVSGKVVLGVKITITADQLPAAMLKLLQDLEVAEIIVRSTGDEQGLTAWISGPRQAEDFIAYWSSVVRPPCQDHVDAVEDACGQGGGGHVVRGGDGHAGRRGPGDGQLNIPPGKYIATRPYDMVSVQE